MNDFVTRALLGFALVFGGTVLLAGVVLIFVLTAEVFGGRRYDNPANLKGWVMSVCFWSLVILASYAVGGYAIRRF